METARTEQLGGTIQSPAWSPDGSTLFVTVNHGRPASEAPRINPVLGPLPRGPSIVAVPLNGGRPHIVLAEEGNDRFGRWEIATDGKRLFFTRAAFESDVWVMDLVRR